MEEKEEIEFLKEQIAALEEQIVDLKEDHRAEIEALGEQLDEAQRTLKEIKSLL